MVVEGFSSIDQTLQWYCQPDSWDNVDGQREGRDGSWEINREGSLVIVPPAKKDFWRKTFYDPVLCKDDGPVLYASLNTNDHFTISTEFTLTAKAQFDQAGIFIRLSPEHWIKTGIEVVDRMPRLSCVVTNIYSDWSTAPYPSSPASSNEEGPATETVTVQSAIRVHCRGSSFVVEAKTPETGKWEFIRIAHLNVGVEYKSDPLGDMSAWSGPFPSPGQMWAGVFACCPEDQKGGLAIFSDFCIANGSVFDHNADGNQEE